MVIERACERLGWKLAELRCVVQGFGNVGGVAATELHDEGRDGHRGLRRLGRGATPPAGLDVPTLHEYVARARLARGLSTARARHERRAARARLRPARPRGARGPGDRRERRRALAAGWSPRAPTARRRSRPTRSSPSAESRCCPTSSRTRAASPSPTSSGCRTSSRLFWDRDEIRARLADKLARRVRPRVGIWPSATGSRCASAALVAGHPRASPRRSRLAGSIHDASEQRVRDAMVPDPLALDAGATAQEAGEALIRPEVRAVLVCDSGRARRRRHPQDARARGRRARARSAARRRSREIAEAPNATIDSAMPLARRLRVARGAAISSASRSSSRGRLVGVLSRSVGAAPARRGRRRRRTAKSTSAQATADGRAGRSGDEQLATASRSCSRISLVDEPAVAVELLGARPTGDLDLGDAGAHRGEHLAELGLCPDRAEHAGARADHGDRLPAEVVGRERARAPVERVLERARDRRVVFRRRDEDGVRAATAARSAATAGGAGSTSSSCVVRRHLLRPS